jgi:spore germination cell wall hydrolase CwlJ-like protein
MSRKTHKISIAALSAVTVLSFASAEFSGAVAQEDASEIAPSAELEVAAGTPTPTFVSTEVVQDVPEVVEEDVAANARAAEEEAAVEAAEAATAVRSAASSLRELVSNTATDYTLSKQMQCLAGAVYFESRGEPLAGQLAVAKVVMNRSEDRRFPNSYCGVVYQRAQFSFVRNGRMPRINTGSGAWKRAKAIARIAHEDQWDSAAADSLYFHANYVRPAWSRKKSRRATIDTHIFYR